MAEATVGAGYAKALMAFAESKDADPQILVKQSGIHPAVLQNPDNRVPVSRAGALMSTAQKLCDDPALATFWSCVVVRRNVDCGPDLSFRGNNGRCTRPIEQVRASGRGVGRPASQDRYQIVRDGHRVWLEDTSLVPGEYPEGAEFVWALFICEHERYFGDLPFAKGVHVPYDPPPYHAEYERVLKVPVVFNSDRNAILIDESWLSIEIPPANRYVFGIFSAHAEALLKSLESSITIRGQVESLVIPIMHTGKMRMEQIAELMGISRQTLYRKLKAEGVTFDRLLDDLRRQIAIHYLNGERVSVNETAYLVGFSERCRIFPRVQTVDRSKPTRRSPRIKESVTPLSICSVRGALRLQEYRFSIYPYEHWVPSDKTQKSLFGQG